MNARKQSTPVQILIFADDSHDAMMLVDHPLPSSPSRSQRRAASLSGHIVPIHAGIMDEIFTELLRPHRNAANALVLSEASAVQVAGKVVTSARRPLPRLNR